MAMPEHLMQAEAHGPPKQMVDRHAPWELEFHAVGQSYSGTYLLKFVAMIPFRKRTADLPVFKEVIPLVSSVQRDPMEWPDLKLNL
jgi:hypothetical protein